MITLPTGVSELKQLFVELLINKTDKVSDVSDNSVLNGVAFGVAKVAQKALKDIAIVEAKIFPDSSSGTYLDRVANLFGVEDRKGPIGSSTYLRIVANPNTVYQASLNRFNGNDGIVFELEANFTVGASGFGYAKVRSVDTGAKANVDANSIFNVTPQPSGHRAVTNEYMAMGGRDREDDEIFRQRIKNSLNSVSIGTLDYLTQVFQNADARVLRVLNLGTSDAGNRELAIITQNGVNLTDSELQTLTNNTSRFFPITDLNRFGSLTGIRLINPTWYIVGGDPSVNSSNRGVDFRVQLEDNANVDTVRRNIQIAMSKYLDFRFWRPNQLVEWDHLLRIVQDTESVRYVSDTEFYPRVDEIVPINQLPRLQNFIMRDLVGNILFDNSNVLSPVFYPST